MGMYTGLRFKGIVKPEFRNMIQSINENDADWIDYAEHYPWLRDFAEKSRSGMIPMGALSYMPDSWEDDSIETAGFRRTFNPDTGYWAFQCSLKNYSSEIEAFIEQVLPNIIEETQHVEELYEEWSSSNLYHLKDGTLHQSGGITYHHHDEEYDWGYE